MAMSLGAPVAVLFGDLLQVWAVAAASLKARRGSLGWRREPFGSKLGVASVAAVVPWRHQAPDMRKTMLFSIAMWSEAKAMVHGQLRASDCSHGGLDVM